MMLGVGRYAMSIHPAKAGDLTGAVRSLDAIQPPYRETSYHRIREIYTYYFANLPLTRDKVSHTLTQQFLPSNPKCSNSQGVLMSIRRLALLFCITAIAVVPATHTFGQAVTATLVGVVSDTTGAGIGGAKVTLTEQQTGATLTQPANASGNYEFTFL